MTIRSVHTMPRPLRWVVAIAAISSILLAMDSLRMFGDRQILDFVITLPNHYYYALIALLLPPCFLIYPMTRYSTRYWYDIILALAAFGGSAFFFINAETMLDHGWEFTAPTTAVWVSYLLWALTLEAVRRCGGITLFVLV